MNLTTRDYDDELDGDYLACKPGDEAEGLEGICRFGMPLVGFAALGNGLYAFYLIYIIRRHRKLLTRQKRYAASFSNARNSRKVHPQSDAKEMFSYTDKLLISTGVGKVGLWLVVFVYGFGTMYPTTHIRGQIGDVAGKK